MTRTAAAAREDFLAGSRVARQLEGGKVGVAATRRLLRDRALDGLGRGRDLALVTPRREERKRCQEEREDDERAAHRAQSNQRCRRGARGGLLVPADGDRGRGAPAEHVPGRVVHQQRDEQRDEDGVRHGQSRTTGRHHDEHRERRQDGERRPEAGEAPSNGDLEPVGDVSENGGRAVAERLGDVAGAAERGIEPDERHAERDDARRCECDMDGAKSRTVRIRDQRRVPREQHEEPAAVRAEAVARDGDERERADGDPDPAEEPRAEQGRYEQHRLEQVRDAVEAAGLRGAERRERDRLRVEPEREEVGREDRGAGDAEREERGRDAEQRDDPPAGEPEVRGERKEDDPRTEARDEDRGDVREAAGEDAQQQPPVVVPRDPAVEALQRGDRVVHLDDLELVRARRRRARRDRRSASSPTSAHRGGPA